MKLLLFKILTLILFLSFLNTGNSQKIARKFVLDNKTQTTIPFVNIKLKNGTKGWISNENGEFEVNIDKLKKSDLFLISAIGYQNQIISYSKFMDTSIITMFPKTFTLNEVEVKTRRYKQGYLEKKRRATANKFNHGFSKRELKNSRKEAIYIPNSIGAMGIIDKVHVFINKGSKTPIEIDILDHDIIKGTPKNSLLSNPILVKEEDDRKWLNISIKNENLSIPNNGFYISINWDIDSIYKEKEDTLIYKATMNGKQIMDTIFSNGIVIGESYSDYRNLWRINLKDEWINTFDEQFNTYSKIYPKKYNDSIKYKYPSPAIYTSILYDKADKHYQKNVFDKNGIVPNKLTAKIIKKKYKKTKLNSTLHPQTDILSLLKSVKKSQVNNDVSYALNHLYFYTYGELEDIINRDIDSTNITLPFLDELIENIDQLLLTEIEQGLYSFEYKKTIYGNLQLNNGVWKLSPTFNIIENNK